MWLRSFAVLFELRARVLANISQRSLGSIDMKSQYSGIHNRNSSKKNDRRDNDTSRHSIDPNALRSIDEMNERIEKLRINSPVYGNESPNNSFGSVSLRRKQQAGTAKH
jgi:hypothetical protein